MPVKHLTRGVILCALLCALSLAAGAWPVVGYPAYWVRTGQPLQVSAPGTLESCTDASTIAVYADAMYGHVQYSPDGAFTYTPYYPDWTGTDWAWYVCYDAQGDVSEAAMVVFYVYADPVAANQSYTLNEFTTLSIGAPGVLTNFEGAYPILDHATLPAHGTLVLYADGSFQYTPAAGFWGTDSFTYIMSDGYSATAPATVTLNVIPAPRRRSRPTA